jgi:hypothetical protein
MGEKTIYEEGKKKDGSIGKAEAGYIYIYESHSTPHHTRREGKREKEKYIKETEKKERDFGIDIIHACA